MHGDTERQMNWREPLAVYREPKRDRILMYVISTAVILIILSGFTTAFVIGSIESIPDMIGAMVGGVFLCGAVSLLAIRAKTYKVERFADGIRVTGIWGARTMLFADYAAYRFEPTVAVSFLPKSRERRVFKIRFPVENQGELYEVASALFVNADSNAFFQEAAEVETNPRWGASAAVRRSHLERAKRTTRWVNIVGGVVTVWGFFCPFPLAATVVPAVYPFIAFVILVQHKGLIRILVGSNSVYPDLLLSFCGPLLALCFRINMGLLNFLTDTLLVYWIFGIGGILALVQLYWIRGLGIKYPGIIALVLSGFIWGYGVIPQLNILLDGARPKIYTSTLLDKRLERYGSTRCHFTIAPFGPQKNAKVVQVVARACEKVEVGDKVLVEYHQGFLQTPWIHLRPHPR